MVGQDDSTRTRLAGLDDTEPSPATPAEPTTRAPAPVQLRDPDRYDKLAEHGRGGLGRVFRARDKELGRVVALKELITRNVSSELRFFREALITARLEHPGIVPVHEAGRWPDGTPFYAMKLVAGRPLKELIAERKTLPDRLALLPNVAAVADAIAYAHERNIIHRDLKPGNVMVGDFGETVVIDWGLAKVLGEPDESDSGGGGSPTSDAELTAAGSVLGTPAFMAPEQARGEPADRRADVFAIGMMLLYLCTGGRTSAAPQGSLASAVDPDLLAIISKATETDPDLRYPDARALAQDLHAFLAGRRVRSRTYNLAELLLHWVRHNTRFLLVAVAVIAGIVVIAGASVRSAQVDRRRADAARDGERRAQAVAERERVAAGLARAAAVSDVDPTAAHALLRDRPLSPGDALVMARALGSGVATYSSPALPRHLTAIAASPDLSRVAFVTEDRVLSVLDVEQGTLAVVATEVAESSPVAWTEGTFVFGASSSAGPIARRSDHPGETQLPTDMRRLEARGEGTLILDAAGALATWTPPAPAYVLATNVTAATWHGDDIVSCSENATLSRWSRDGRASAAGACDPVASVGALVGAGASLLVPLPDSRVELRRSGQVRRLPVPSGRAVARTALSDTGDAAMTDAAGQGFALTASGLARAVEGATCVAARDRWLAWGHDDGRVTVRDTVTLAEWTLQAHTDAVRFVAVDPVTARVLTASADTIRLWHLSRTPPQEHGRYPCVPDRIVPNPTSARLVAGQCLDGVVVIIDLDARTVNVTDRHRAASTPLVWNADSICTGGLDGSIVCTAASNSATTSLGRHPTPVRALTSDGARLYSATADGSVFEVRVAETPRTLARIDGEPNALRVVSPELLVTTTRAGAAVFIDLRDGKLEAVKAHHDVPSGVVASSSGDVLIGSWEGSVSRWNRSAFRARHIAPQPVRDLHATGSGFAALVGTATIWIESAELSLTLDLGAAIRGLATTRGYAAAATQAGDVVLVDVIGRRLASIRIGAPLTSLAALDDRRFATTAADGALFIVDAGTAAWVAVPAAP